MIVSVVSWESSGSLLQLKQEECAGERGLHSPSLRERAEDALRGVVPRSSRGIMLFSNDTVSCCSIQLPREAARGGGGEAGPAGAGGCAGEGVVPIQETQERDLAELGLAQSQHCNGSRPLGLVSPGTIYLSLFLLGCKCS